MNPFETAEAVQASRAKGEDRVGVVRFEDRLVIVVADGAGGTSCGGTVATDGLFNYAKPCFEYSELHCFRQRKGLFQLNFYAQSKSFRFENIHFRGCTCFKSCLRNFFLIACFLSCVLQNGNSFTSKFRGF